MKKTTNVHFILDRSSSMDSVREATISGFNEYIDTLKKDKKSSYKFSLTFFDTSVESVYTNKAISKVEHLTEKTYVPNGCTALYDSIHITLSKVKAGDKNLVVIMTDGGENASQECDMETLKKQIKALEKSKKWTFVFLGANQNAWNVGQKFGMQKGNTSTYNSTLKGVKVTMSTLGETTRGFSAQSCSSTNNYFSADDQDKLENAK